MYIVHVLAYTYFYDSSDKEFLLLEISANQYIILVEVEKSSVAEVNN